jgi:hypothetical protein
MRWPGLLLRILGWLLTPLVAWAASFLGAWLFVRTAAAFPSGRSAMLATLGVAVGSGIGALLVWMQLLRRSPRLRHSLHVTVEGLPLPEDQDEPDPPPAG